KDREEISAGIGRKMLGDELHIGHDPKQHVAYVDSSIQILTEKPFEIHQAADDAQKISDFLMAYDRKMDLNQNIESVQDKTQVQAVSRENEYRTSIKIGR